MVRLLLEWEDVDANIRIPLSWAARQWASEKGHEAGGTRQDDIEVNSRDLSGRTPCHGQQNTRMKQCYCGWTKTGMKK